MHQNIIHSVSYNPQLIFTMFSMCLTLFHFLYHCFCAGIAALSSHLCLSFFLAHRFCLTRSEGPTLTAMDRWMRTSPLASHSIMVSAASTTAFTLMNLFSISPGTGCQLVRKYLESENTRLNMSYELMLVKTTWVLSAVLWGYSKYPFQNQSTSMHYTKSFLMRGKGCFSFIWQNVSSPSSNNYVPKYLFSSMLQCTVHSEWSRLGSSFWLLITTKRQNYHHTRSMFFSWKQLLPQS